ncbi:MAG: methyltransferase domain-containing protein, partial [Saprospiraceae bacterium]|nr:methyltransferase domain-containing protein [Saprospiraceae bacterium]
KEVLDIGCGYGEMAQYLFAQRIASYHGIDPSRKMIERAQQQLANPLAQFQIGQAESMSLESGRYDLVISRLVFHYVEDLAPIFKQIYESLCPHGTFIFSVEHPVMTALMDKAKAGSKKAGWQVGAYFREGPRRHQWMGSAVTKYHKTIEQYFAILSQSGFIVQELREGRPERQHFSEEKEFDRRLDLPRYLILKAYKPTK